jgi:hypothetical protein
MEFLKRSEWVSDWRGGLEEGFDLVYQLFLCVK